MNRLPIAVKCRDCNNLTRNLTGFCHHHQRNSQMTGQVSPSGALLNVRLSEVERLRSTSPESIEDNAILGGFLVRNRPDVMVDLEHHTSTVRNAFMSTDEPENFLWGGEEILFHPSGESHVGSLSFMRSGKDMVIYPSAGLPHSQRAEMNSDLKEDAHEAAEAIRKLRAVIAELDTKSESYDDKAEILAQLRLGGNDAGAVRYSVPEDGKLTVFVRSPMNPEVIERWSLERQMELVDNGSDWQPFTHKYKVVGSGELVSRRTREKIADEIDEFSKGNRAELIQSICEAIEVIDKHAVTSNGRVHLPIGWTD